MRWQKLTAVILAVLLLAGCSEPTNTQLIPTTVPTVSTVSTVSTEPPATTSPTLPPEEPQEKAQRISQGYSVLVNQQDVTETLSDGSVYSKVQLTAGETLKVESQQPFSSLYLI